MNQILMAAARGARVQALHGNVWSGVAGVHLGDMPHTYRIHPDDDHLRFGPISTALREAATKDINYLQDSLGIYERAVIEDYQKDFELGYCWDTAMNKSQLHKSLFLLILSEALAEDGL